MPDVFLPSGAAAPAEFPDLLGALNDFILAFCLPQLTQERLFHTHQNHSFLPPADHDYAIIQHISGERRGTAVQQLVSPRPGEDPEEQPGLDGLLLTGSLSLEECQVDFYGPQAQFRARALGVVFMSAPATDFLQPYQVSPADVRAPQNLTGLSGPGKGGPESFVPRYMLRLFFCLSAGLGVDQPWFREVKLKNLRLANKEQ